MISRALAFGLITLGTGAGAETPAGATTLHLVSTPAVSPDGKTMVFEWIDDLWTAPSEGGEAVRVEKNPGLEDDPRFSPDGKRIVFTSRRSGSAQVYSIPAGGGEAVRHTWHTEGCELAALSPDGTRAIIRGLRERHGLRESRLAVIDLTRDSREQRLFDAAANEASWSPDGTRILFTTVGEAMDRKGHRGSRAPQVWQFEMAGGTFERRITDDTGAANPVWHPDGKGFWFLSGRGGVHHLASWREGDAAPVALMKEKDESVSFRVPSADGTVWVVRRGSGLFRCGPDGVLRPIHLWTRADLPDATRDRRTIMTTTDADFTAARDETVFAAGGDLWRMATKGGGPTRLTETPEAESDVRFSPDGRWLYFLRDDGLKPDFFRAEFADGSLRREQRVTEGPLSKSQLRPSPNGARIAWVEGNGEVFTAAADGTERHRVFSGWDHPDFDWSPDGNWLVIAAGDRNANTDLWLADASGSRAALNLTRHPAPDESPRWAPDGRSLVFSARRDADGKSRLWKIDFGRNGLAVDFQEAALLRLADEAKPLPTGGIEPIRVIWSADGKSILFQNRSPEDRTLWSLDPVSGAVRSRHEGRGMPVRMTGAGTLFWRTNGTPALLGDGGNRPMPFSVTIERSRTEVLTLAFRRVWRTLGERFRDPEMNGKDWQALRLVDEPAAAMARTSWQFERTVNRLLGELNASHLSFEAAPWPGEALEADEGEETAHPGFLLEDGPVDGPLVISRVIAGSPVAGFPEAPRPGDVIVRIAGEGVTAHSPLHRFFNGGLGKSLPLRLRSPDGNERTLELRCISHPAARALDRMEKETAARTRVTGAGRFSYLKLHDMGLESFNALELAVYRASLESNGLVLDLRDNNGGREADRILSLFCQPVHAFTVPRGGPAGYPQARRVHAAWDKPLVVICNRNTFSNAEIFCHAMRLTRRAPLVGETTAGGVSSAVKIDIPDAGLLQVPFRSWFQAGNGMDLDRNGAVPDFPVTLTPADEAAGRDPQLEKALELLVSGGW